jgi:hypothetical protein
MNNLICVVTQHLDISGKLTVYNVGLHFASPNLRRIAIALVSGEPGYYAASL